MNYNVGDIVQQIGKPWQYFIVVQLRFDGLEVLPLLNHKTSLVEWSTDMTGTLPCNKTRLADIEDLPDQAKVQAVSVKLKLSNN